MKIVAYFLELCETHLRDDAPLLCLVDSCGSLRVLNLCETLPSWREFTIADTFIYLVDTVVLHRGESACLPRVVYQFCCELCIDDTPGLHSRTLY